MPWAGIFPPEAHYRAHGCCFSPDETLDTCAGTLQESGSWDRVCVPRIQLGLKSRMLLLQPPHTTVLVFLWALVLCGRPDGISTLRRRIARGEPANRCNPHGKTLYCVIR